VTKKVRKAGARRLDSLLGHCLIRATVAEYGQSEAATEGPETGEPVSTWSALRAATKATPKASRVAGFIIQWAIAMRMENRDEFSITEYQRYWAENERKAYRLQKEFRELWPEFETPNELARQVVEQVGARMSTREAAALPTKVMVTA
jgi:hypothetical protein